MPRKYVKTGKTPEGTARRMRAFRHNSLTGYVAMSRQHMLAIINADSTTEEAKDTAASALGHLDDLSKLLKIRVD